MGDVTPFWGGLAAKLAFGCVVRWKTAWCGGTYARKRQGRDVGTLAAEIDRRCTLAKGGVAIDRRGL